MPLPDAPQVVALGHTAALGGAELALARLLDAVDGRSVAVRTILFEPGPLAERLVRAGHPVEVLPLGASVAASRHDVGRSPWAVARAALRVVPFAARLAARLGRLRPTLVVANTLKAGLIGVPVARLLGIPVVWHVHDRISPDYLPPLLVRVVRFVAARLATAVVANSLATAQTLPGVRDLVVAYPGFDAAQVGKRPATVRTSAPVVGILGRISPTKGQLVFVEAAASVVEAHPDARFSIIGSPMFGAEAYAETVRATIARLGLADAVTLTGFVADPAAALDRLTICVHASPTPEPFGQVIVEAMLRGVPVIATSGGGASEIMDAAAGSQVGWVVPPGDAGALASAIVAALDDPDEALRRARRAYDAALDRFPIERTAEAVTAAWRRAAHAR